MTKLKVIFLLSSLWTAYAMVASEGEFKKSLAGGEGCSGAPVSIAHAASEQDTNAKEKLIAKVEAAAISKTIYNAWILAGGSQTDYFLARDKDESLKSTLAQNSDLAQTVANNAIKAQMDRPQTELITDEKQIRLEEIITVFKKYAPTPHPKESGELTDLQMQNSLCVHPHQLTKYNEIQKSILLVAINQEIENLKRLDAVRNDGIEASRKRMRRIAAAKEFFYTQHETVKSAHDKTSFYHELQNPSIYKDIKNFEGQLRSIIAKEEAAKNIPQK